MAQTSTPGAVPGHPYTSPAEPPTLAALASDAVKAYGKRHRPRYRQKRAQEAADKTAAVVARQGELDGILTDYLQHPATGIDMEALKQPFPKGPEVDPRDAEARPAPEWDHYAPPTLKGLGKLTGGGAYAKQRAQAARIFSMAVENYEATEAARKKRVRQIKQAQAELVARTREQHLNIDRFVTALRNRERKAVSRYFQQVIDELRDPDGLPTQRRAGYLPETGLLALEWQLPPLDVMPQEKSFSYDAGRDFIETKHWSDGDRLRGYQRLIAQIALRAVHAVVGSDRYAVIDTVVFNGVVDSVDTRTNRPIRPCLISLSTTPMQFTALELDKGDPARCARDQLRANVSPRPERLYPVTPVLDFAEADPRKIHRPHR
jgi:restriction system protein